MPIHTSHDDALAIITIDRPERRGAIDLAHLEALDAALTTVLAEGARALVITGSDGHFCAGADLTELEDISFTVRLAEVLARLASAPITTVAAISGSCMGLGMQLAVACDLRVVAGDARFALPVAKLGLMVDHWTLDRVTRFFGEGAARALALTATVLDADDAWRLGFAQARGGIDDARALATAAIPLAPLTQAGSKLGFDAASAEDLAAYRAAFEAAWASRDLQEGQAAFSERRSPIFEGR